MHRMLVGTGLALLAAAGLLQWTVLGGYAADASVTAANLVFEDSVSGSDVSTITAGDTVTWTFADGEPHTVTSDTGAFSSGAQQVGGTYQFTFNSAGTYDYYCQIHGAPGGVGMAGTVIVQEPPATNTPQATDTSAPGTTNTPTRTATRTPQATSTGTVTAVPSAAIATATPIVAAPISATEVLGERAAPIAAPSVGTGDAASTERATASVLAMALGAAGALAIAASLVVRQRR